MLGWLVGTVGWLVCGNKKRNKGMNKGKVLLVMNEV